MKPRTQNQMLTIPKGSKDQQVCKTSIWFHNTKKVTHLLKNWQ